MIELREGNLLEADVEALVNTVNTVGVMGKGIALQFRKMYPDNYEAYRRACAAKAVQPGKMFVFETVQLIGQRLIINFPTKRHWKGRSRIEDIERGLDDLVEVLKARNVKSVAMPPLGCGNGGLPWSEVKPRIEAALSRLPELRVLLYAPSGAPAPGTQRVRTKRPAMTRGRAALLAALDSYRTDPSVKLTQLVAQKLAYLLQSAGEPLKLDFGKGEYGPYAEVMNHVLQRMDGHFIVGYGDRTGRADIRLKSDAIAGANELLAADPEAQRRVDRMRTLIDGFESPLGLELLTTVHWAAREAGVQSPEDAARFVANWTPRKQRVFRPQHVLAAWERLDSEGWLADARREAEPAITRMAGNQQSLPGNVVSS